MWWAGRPLDVYLGTRAVAVCDGGRLLFHQAVGGWRGSLEAARAFLETTSASTRRRKLAIWLSGSMGRPFLLPAIDGIRSEAERTQVLEAMARERTGLEEPLRVWADYAARGRVAAAVAVEVEVVDCLYEALKGRRTICSIRPFWAEVLRWALASRPSLQALAVQDCDSVTMLVGAERGFHAMTTINGVEDRATADAVIARSFIAVEVPDGMALTVNWRGVGAEQPMLFAMSTLTEVPP